MKTIIIDDDLNSNDYLSRVLAQVSSINVVKVFTNGISALNEFKEIEPDIVFLDIEILGVNGLELLKEFKAELPTLHIVIVTTHKKHAIQAFNLHVSDFIIKPVKKKRLLEVIQRILQVEKTKLLREELPTICCFKTLKFKIKSKTIFVKWRTTMSKDVFLYLLHFRGENIRKDVIVEEFWPEEEVKVGYSKLYTVIYMVRKALKDANIPIIIESNEGSYKLNLNGVQMETERWEQKLSQLSPLNEKTYISYKKVFNLYKGHFLEMEQLLWTEADRQRLRTKWLGLLNTLSEYLIEKNDFYEAILLHLKVIKIEPLFEESYFTLMQLGNKVGDRSIVERYYKYLEKMLLDNFGVEPDESIQKWYRKWRTGVLTNRYKV